MDRPTIFTYWQIQDSKDVNSPQIDTHRFGAIPIKISARFFADIDKIILKFMWKGKEITIA